MTFYSKKTFPFLSLRSLRSNLNRTKTDKSSYNYGFRQGTPCIYKMLYCFSILSQITNYFLSISIPDAFVFL
ncbi:MAG: hypothetical protein ACPG5B_06385 [Chitinophagales bacterium]